VRCRKCDKKLDALDTDSQFFKQAGVCIQCGMEGSLEVACEVCGKVCYIGDVTIFMRHYVCNECRIEDLLNTVEVECEKCGKIVKLINACEYRGKHACRECGLKMLRGENTGEEGIEAQSTARFMKWLGL